MSPIRPAGLVSCWEREYGALGFAWVNGTLIASASLYMLWEYLRRRARRPALRLRRKHD